MNKSGICFYCGSSKAVKNGKTYYGKPRCKCKGPTTDPPNKKKKPTISNDFVALFNTTKSPNKIPAKLNPLKRISIRGLLFIDIYNIKSALKHYKRAF